MIRAVLAYVFAAVYFILKYILVDSLIPLLVNIQVMSNTSLVCQLTYEHNSISSHMDVSSSQERWCVVWIAGLLL